MDFPKKYQMIPQPIGTAAGIRQLDQLLQTLLPKLSAADWASQTVAKLWKVKDVVAHLLDGNIRALSMLRDGYFGEQPGEESLVGFLNRLNADWVQAMKRVSPEMLILLHQLTGPRYCEYIESLDLDAEAVFPVGWAAAPFRNKNWMHIAREYTEKWLHQQQIRAAIGDDSLLEPDLFTPFINTFMIGMPRQLARHHFPEGKTIQIEVSGKSLMIWYLAHKGDRWVFIDQPSLPTTAKVILPNRVAWKLFSKSIRYDEVEEKIQLFGEKSLARAAVDLVAVMA